MKNKTTTVICKLSNLPIISVGLVKICSIFSNFWFKNTSEPVTMKTENIEILFNTSTLEVKGDGQLVSSILTKNNITGEIKDIPATGFFVAIGHKPNTDIFKPYIDMDSTGYIINKPGSTKTNIEGVFVSGDAADHTYRQAITAAGTGCMAALDAERYLASK